MRWKPNLFIFFIFLYIASIFFYEYGKAWVSIAMFGILLATLAQGNFLRKISTFFQQNSFLWISLSVLILPIYIFNTDNFQYYFERIQIRAPLLLLPFAFSLVNISKKVYQTLLCIFVMICFGVAMGTFINYLFDIDGVNESYLRSQVMPSILNHVRFSIMVAMASYLAYYLYRCHFYWKHPSERWLFLFIAIVLFIFVHIYSVRSGIVALYAAVFVETIFYIHKSKNYSIASGVLIALLVLSAVAMKVIPTLNNKLKNTLSDIEVYKTQSHPNFNSLTTRMISYEAAIAIFKESPLFGCGLGDIKDVTDAYFRKYYPTIDTPILPHNQFLFWLAACGITGLFYFSATFFFPLFEKRNWSNRVLIVHYVILFLSFQSEPMLETQLGVAYSLLFILLPLTQREETSNMD